MVKPGRNPISVVLNEASKRKTGALVGFINGDRLLGEEAVTASARYPDKVYARYVRKCHHKIRCFSCFCTSQCCHFSPTENILSIGHFRSSNLAVCLPSLHAEFSTYLLCIGIGESLAAELQLLSCLQLHWHASDTAMGLQGSRFAGQTCR